ncbi:MAG: amidohydrolase family protein [Deltaproteobacteria bacterium]|nr:amidohydrolase family protein [Deltaproteobacteria bacterium]
MGKINDVHIHLGPSGPWKPNLDPSTTVEQVLEFKRKNNIDKCVVFPNPWVGSKYPEMNDYIIKAAREYPGEFIPFGRIDPRDKEEAKKEVRRLARKGIAGIKVHPVVECFRPDHPFFLDVYQEIVKHRMFIIAHSYDTGFGNASYWKPVCNRLGNLKLILCHINKEAITLLANYENVFVDTSATFVKSRFDISKLDSRKILLGSDYPYVDDIPRQLKKIERLNFNGYEKKNILHRNFNRLFKDFI